MTRPKIVPPPQPQSVAEIRLTRDEFLRIETVAFALGELSEIATDSAPYPDNVLKVLEGYLWPAYESAVDRNHELLRESRGGDE